MATQRTASHERDESDRTTAALAHARRSVESGTGALLAGGALLIHSFRSRRRGRAALQALVGIVLVGVGLRQRQSDRGDEDVSDDAHAAIEQRTVGRPTGGNPRDVADEPGPDPEAEDEGDVQFTREQRGDETTDDTEGAEVEIDISEAAMADEPGEAAGPSPEQSQPTTTKDETTTPTDTVDVDDQTGVDAEAGDTTGHADTMESGTMDVDEDDVTDTDEKSDDEPTDADSQTDPRTDEGEADDEN